MISKRIKYLIGIHLLVSVLLFIELEYDIFPPFLEVLISLVLFINHPDLYPILYWITYISALFGILSVVYTLLWYLVFRRKFSTPVKKGGYTAFKVYTTILILIFAIQFYLSYTNLLLLLQISFYLFLSGTLYLLCRSLIYLYTSVMYQYNWDRSYHQYVSIIVPAYNEEVVIADSIKSLLEIDYEPFEIIVVNDGSTDQTATVLEQFNHLPRVRIINQRNGGKWSALNNGIMKSKGKIMVCIDADTKLHPLAISRLASHFRREEVVAVAGNVKVGNRISQLTKLQSLEYIAGLNILKRSEAYFHKLSVIPGPLGAFRKNKLIEVGLFSEDTFAEDADMTFAFMRLNNQMIYDPTAIGYTEAPSTLLDLMKQRYRWYRGLLQTMLKHKDMVFNKEYQSTGFFFVPWTYLNNLIFSWFSYFVSIWLFILMFMPNTGFVIYNPNPVPPDITIFIIDLMMQEGLSIFVSTNITNLIPSVYIIWFFFFLLLDIVFVTYSLRIDFKENLSLVPYILHFKLFYGYMNDTFRILSHLEEFLGYPMSWETATRTNTINITSGKTQQVTQMDSRIKS